MLMKGEMIKITGWTNQLHEQQTHFDGWLVEGPEPTCQPVHHGIYQILRPISLDFLQGLANSFELKVVYLPVCKAIH